MRSTVLTVLLLAACGGSDGENNPPSGPPPASAEVSLLFMGNSDTSANNLTGMVAEICGAVRPGKSVASVEAPGWMFMEERVNAPASTVLFRRFPPKRARFIRGEETP
jgi:hypothetical protein